MSLEKSIEEQLRIHHRAIQRHAPMQMRPGDPAGGADFSDHLPAATWSPAFTAMLLRWQYIVTSPAPWSM